MIYKTITCKRYLELKTAQIKERYGQRTKARVRPSFYRGFTHVSIFSDR